MRVVAGYLGGRTFSSPAGHKTHPMSERARGALFNTLGDISSLTVLDAFAGTGALCIEAISRGALRATAIDIDKNATTTISENTKNLGISEKVKVIRANATGWSDQNPDLRFDLLFLDPPYNDIRPSSIIRMAEHVEVDGIAVLSLPPDVVVRLPLGFQELSLKSYGDNTLRFFRRVK